MKKTIILIISCAFLFAFGFGSFASSSSVIWTPLSSDPSTASNVYMIEDFESDNQTLNPMWWKFDNIIAIVVENAKFQKGGAGSCSRDREILA